MSFRDSLPSVSRIVLKFKFIGIISGGDAIALQGKNNLQHLYITTRN